MQYNGNVKEVEEEVHEKIFIGIDPGKNGGAAIINEMMDSEPIITFRCPKTPTEMALSLMSTIPVDVSYDDVLVLIEHVHAMPKNGVVSMFSFGQNLGHWEGTLYANEFDFSYVNPKEWIYWYGIPKGLDKKKRKRLLLEKAKELFPNMKITFNVSDAMLIANYCMEMYYKNKAKEC